MKKLYRMLRTLAACVAALTLLAGTAHAKPLDIQKHSYEYHMAAAGSLTGEELIAAAIRAEQRAARAVMFYDMVNERGQGELTNISRMGGAQKLRMVAWGAYRSHSAHIASATAYLCGGYETFYAIISPRDRMKAGHSLVLTFVGDDRILWHTQITADTQRFSMELDVTGVNAFTVQIQTNDHSDSTNPGIEIENAYLD